MQENPISVISINDLVPGMYVNKVTKQSGTLRMKSQGLVKKTEIIAALKSKGILELEIDYSKSNLEEIEKHKPQEEPEEAKVEEKPKRKAKVPMGEALNASQELHDQAKQVHEDFINKVRSGESISLEPVKGVTEQIIDSIFDNPNTLCCVSMIKDSPDYILEHSVNCAIYMTIFAKHMGFDKELTEELCLAGFLMDTGMATVPEDVLSKPGKLNDEEMKLVKSHVDLGLEIIEQSDDVSDVVLGVMRDHHERLDGSGYPEGKSGDNINVYGRMAAIVDSYDSLTNDRPHRLGATPTAALKKLLADSTGRYDQALVQQFIRSIGVHPVGSLVKLKSGKLGIIVQAHKDDPLKPLIMCFYNIRTGHHTEIKRVDLSKVDDEIVSSVKPAEFKLNLTKFFREVFIPSIP